MNLNPDPVDPIHDVHKVLIEGVKEIIGPEDTRAMFLRDRSKTEGMPTLADLQDALIERYGRHGGQGMALRIGKAIFHHALRRWGPASGLSGNSFRLLPYHSRIHTGLVMVASLFNEASDAAVIVSEDARAWYWLVERCPACGDQSVDGPACYLLVGLLQAFMSWAGNSRTYQVREIECAGSGAPACLFQIDKRAFE